MLSTRLILVSATSLSRLRRMEITRFQKAVRIVSAIALAGSGLMVTSVPPGSAASTQPTNGWIIYRPLNATPGAQISLIQGKSDGAGGCNFSASGTSISGQSPTDMVEVAFNASTCQSKFATSTLPSSNGSAVVAGQGASTSGSAPATLSSGVKTMGAALTSSYLASAWVRTQFHDPVDITVNEVQENVDWNYYGGCVTAAAGGYYYYWDVVTGWSLNENNWQNSYNCDSTTQSTYAHFHNRPFCGLTATDTYYDRTTLHGLFDGAFSWTTGWSKTGLCQSLLTFELQHS